MRAWLRGLFTRLAWWRPAAAEPRWQRIGLGYYTRPAGPEDVAPPSSMRPSSWLRRRWRDEL